MRVGGLTPLSTTDYPGYLSAVVFCQGCPWRCDYCHNPHLIPAEGCGMKSWQEVASFLERRRGLLDAVVFSGGEPTLQAGLSSAMETVRDMGFRVGLHTAGIYPERLARLLPVTDWVGLDIKAPFDDYARVTGVPMSGGAARACVLTLLDSDVEHECRTTLDDSLLGMDDVEEIATSLAALGVRNYALQACRHDGVSDIGILQLAAQRIAPLFEHFTLRA